MRGRAQDGGPRTALPGGGAASARSRPVNRLVMRGRAQDGGPRTALAGGGAASARSRPVNKLVKRVALLMALATGTASAAGARVGVGMTVSPATGSMDTVFDAVLELNVHGMVSPDRVT